MTSNHHNNFEKKVFKKYFGIYNVYVVFKLLWKHHCRTPFLFFGMYFNLCALEIFLKSILTQVWLHCAIIYVTIISQLMVIHVCIEIIAVLRFQIFFLKRYYRTRFVNSLTVVSPLPPPWTNAATGFDFCTRLPAPANNPYDWHVD